MISNPCLYNLDIFIFLFDSMLDKTCLTLTLHCYKHVQAMFYMVETTEYATTYTSMTESYGKAYGVWKNTTTDKILSNICYEENLIQLKMKMYDLFRDVLIKTMEKRKAEC